MKMAMGYLRGQIVMTAHSKHRQHVRHSNLHRFSKPEGQRDVE